MRPRSPPRLPKLLNCPVPGQHLFLACYGFLALSFLYLAIGYRLRTNLVVVLLVALTIPSFAAAHDPRSSLFRWVGWLLLLGTAGPLFLNEVALKLRVLFWTRRLVVVCAVGSLVVNLLGIRLNGRGIFPGLMGHSMLLAPVSALAVIDLFCQQKKQASSTRLALIVLCCMACVGAGSRGAVLALAAGIAVHVAHRREGLYVAVLSVFGLAIVSYIELDRASYSEKLGGNVFAELSAKGTTNTREQLWGFRLREFSESPLYGVGFQQQRFYRERSNREFLEPGSGYLAVLSMTGIIGAAGFLWLAVHLFQSLATHSEIPAAYRGVLRGWMVFFVVHFVVEGYVFACGSLLAMLFWLTVGCCLSLHHQTGVARRRRQQRRRLERRTTAHNTAQTSAQTSVPSAVQSSATKMTEQIAQPSTQQTVRTIGPASGERAT